jgi:hypothetical protein
MMYGLAWKILAVCFGKAQNPPEMEGESTQISPTTSGGQMTLVSGLTIANVASAMGYPNPPTRTIPGSFARRRASSPYILK